MANGTGKSAMGRPIAYRLIGRDGTLVQKGTHGSPVSRLWVSGREFRLDYEMSGKATSAVLFYREVGGN